MGPASVILYRQFFSIFRASVTVGSSNVGPLLLLNALEKIRNERLRSVFGGCLLIFLFSFFF